MFRRIPCDWFLSDGILSPVRLETAETVANALRHAGILAERASVKDALRDEWIYRREWRYSASFAAEESDRRRHLSVTGLCGRWTVRLNGRELAAGTAPTFEAEIPEPLRAEGNQIEICFAPPDPRVGAPELGFRGAFSLRETDAIVIRSLKALGSPAEGYRLEAEIEAQADCKCQLRLALRVKGKTFEKTTPAALIRGRQLLALTPFAADAWPRGELATVSLGILADDWLSDEVSVCLYLPDAALIPRGFAGEGEFAAAACAEAGGNALRARLDAAVLAADHRLVLNASGPAPVSALSALARETLLTALTENDLEALNGDALWLLTGSDREAFRETERLFHAEEGDWAQKSRLSRYYQAIDLRRRAEDARLQGEPFLLEGTCDTAPRVASSALFDADAQPRPAYCALTDAWKRDHAFVRAPQLFPEDGIINVPIYYVTDGSAAGVTINAIALRPDGQELVSATFPAAGRADGLVGRLCTELSENGLVLLRTRVMKNGECLSVSDDIICREPKNLLSLPETQLLWDGNVLKNVGGTAAVGVSVPGAHFFGTLLPGESVALSAPGPKFYEAFNTFE